MSVRPYLNWVAPDAVLNPREVKRYINAYTLQRLVKPELRQDVILALLTLSFRTDWQEVTDDWFAEPDVFQAALAEVRAQRDPALLQDYFPASGPPSADLGDFLLSQDADGLATVGNLDYYLTSLESTVRSQAWTADAMRELVKVRCFVRDQGQSLSASGGATQGDALSAISMIRRLLSSNSRTGAEIFRHFDELEAQLKSFDGATSEGQWRHRTQQLLDQVDQALRRLRHSTRW